MRVTAGLAALAAGAILTFAVSARVPGINLRLTGVIIMLAAIAGLVATSQAAQAWLRRAARRGQPPGPDEDQFGDLGFLLQDPAVLAAEVLRSAAGTGRPDGGRPGA